MEPRTEIATRFGPVSALDGRCFRSAGCDHVVVSVGRWFVYTRNDDGDIDCWTRRRFARWLERAEEVTTRSAEES